MRLSTGEDRDEERSHATIAAATAAGITVFDTARSYGRTEDELGHNERLLARALRGVEAARIVTKGGMARAGGAWVAGRPGEGAARRLRGEPRRARRPSDRPLPRPRSRPADAVADDAARARPARRGRARRSTWVSRTSTAGSSTRRSSSRRSQPSRSRSASSTTGRCAAGSSSAATRLGIALIAHSPLGGPRRAGGLARRDELAAVAAEHDATPAEVALAWLLDLSPLVVPIPGARRPEAARSAARAATLELTESDRERLAPGPARPKRAVPRVDADVVLVMGIQGAGKTRVAEELRRRAATSVSTATSAAVRCGRSPPRWTRRWESGARGSSSTTRT